MKYFLRPGVIHPATELPISAERFRLLETSRGLLVHAFEFEELYEIFVTNYSELEKLLLSIAVDGMVERYSGYYGDIFARRVRLTVALLSFLTSARVYIDQSVRHLPKPVRTLLKQGRSKQYDALFEYRFMEALRNHAQHRALPIHTLKSNASWTGHKASDVLEHVTSIHCEKEALDREGDFKASVLGEMPESVELRRTIRAYVEALSQVHVAARDAYEPQVQAARAAIELAHADYEVLNIDRLMGLSAFAQEEDESGVGSSFPLTLSWDDVRIVMTKKNLALTNLSRCVVTSKMV